MSIGEPARLSAVASATNVCISSLWISTVRRTASSCEQPSSAAITPGRLWSPSASNSSECRSSGSLVPGWASIISRPKFARRSRSPESLGESIHRIDLRARGPDQEHSEAGELELLKRLRPG